MNRTGGNCVPYYKRGKPTPQPDIYIPDSPEERRMIRQDVLLLRDAIRVEVTPERIRRIFDKMCNLAEQGDKTAARLVLEYAIGKPKEVVEMNVETTGVQTVQHLSTETLQQVYKLLKTPEVVEGEVIEGETSPTQD